MERQLVVAKYKEDMAWLLHVPWDTFVYDKCPSVGRHDFPHVQYIEMGKNPLAGRESHSYVHHILEHYDSLPDITFFVQGNPFDHCPSFLDTIHHEYRETTGLGIQSHGGIVVPMIHELDYPGPPFPWKLSVRKADEYLAGKWSFLFPDTPVPGELVFVWGQQYAVPRRRILQRTSAFYRKMFRELARHEPHTALGIDAYSLEFLMFYVWGDERYSGHLRWLRKMFRRCMA